MNCTNCGATVTPGCLERGACTFCGAAIQPVHAIQAAQGPSLQHGVAEILQALAQGQTQGVQTFVSSSIVINGQTYRSVDELPSHLRATFAQGMQKAQQALGSLGANVMVQNITTQASFEVPVHRGNARAYLPGLPGLPGLPAPAAVESVEELAAARRKGRVGTFIALAVVLVLMAAATAMVFGR